MHSSSQRSAVHPSQPCGLPTPRGAVLRGGAYQVGLLPWRALRTLTAQPSGLVVELILATAGLLRTGPAYQGRLPRGRGSFGLHSPLETPTVSGQHLEVVVEEPWGGPLQLMTWQSSPDSQRLHPKRLALGAPQTPLKAWEAPSRSPQSQVPQLTRSSGLTFPAPMA